MNNKRTAIKANKPKFTQDEKKQFVYNDNNTIWDKSDDQFTKITTGLGSGNLPNNYVYCLANDLEGNIWVGTKEGVCVFYSPSSVFSGYNFDAQQIIVEENGFGQYLLNAEIGIILPSFYYQPRL